MSFKHDTSPEADDTVKVIRAAGRRWIWRWEGWFLDVAGGWASAGWAMTRSGALVKALRKQSRQRQHAEAAGDRIVAQAPRIYGTGKGGDVRVPDARLVTHEDALAAGLVPEAVAISGEVVCERPGCPNRATLEEVRTPFGCPLVCGEHAREVREWLELLLLPLSERPMGTGVTTGVWVRGALRWGPTSPGERAAWLLLEAEEA
jgi:hypothetical protein